MNTLYELIKKTKPEKIKANPPSGGGKDIALYQSLLALPATAAAFVVIREACFLFHPFGWSSQWSWGSVHEPHWSSNSWMA